MGYFAQTLTTNKILCTLLVIELSMSYMMVMGEVYKVGDSAGWDVNSNLDYQSWASSKTFRVDDVLCEYHRFLTICPVALVQFMFFFLYAPKTDSFNMNHHFYLKIICFTCHIDASISLI
ncbi:cupredoxin superfamily protein [Artemisia annua]|uniref:Cupredoxin superfamily protein n=1 Tax=Artemisia annua TaxID=35608 RepID=A0A2U1M927_ARTAN|nr:cupredoxin superfamily protein [Artemisia annua]